MTHGFQKTQSTLDEGQCNPTMQTQFFFFFANSILKILYRRGPFKWNSTMKSMNEILVKSKIYHLYQLKYKCYDL